MNRRSLVTRFLNNIILWYVIVVLLYCCILLISNHLSSTFDKKSYSYARNTNSELQNTISEGLKGCRYTEFEECLASALAFVSRKYEGGYFRNGILWGKLNSNRILCNKLILEVYNRSSFIESRPTRSDGIILVFESSNTTKDEFGLRCYNLNFARNSPLSPFGTAKMK